MSSIYVKLQNNHRSTEQNLFQKPCQNGENFEEVDDIDYKTPKQSAAETVRTEMKLPKGEGLNPR